jgi:hypothetical protein
MRLLFHLGQRRAFLLATMLADHARARGLQSADTAPFLEFPKGAFLFLILAG